MGVLLVVRHAKAGKRGEWPGPDEERPLSSRGRRQAEALVPVLADHPVDRILSSPYTRCVETVEPLAEKIGVPVETVAVLSETADRADQLALARQVVASGTVVLCTHGDVVPPLLGALAASDGLALPDPLPSSKASTWVLAAGADGRFASADYVPPPA